LIGYPYVFTDSKTLISKEHTKENRNA